jgi:hypothetical protein
MQIKEQIQVIFEFSGVMYVLDHFFFFLIRMYLVGIGKTIRDSLRSPVKSIMRPLLTGFGLLSGNPHFFQYRHAITSP